MGGRIPAFDDHENVLKLKRRQKSPLKDEEESLLLTPFDKPKAKGERKPLEDPSLENMGKLNKQPSKQEIDVNEKEIDGPGEVTNRLETKTEPKPKETKTSKPETKTIKDSKEKLGSTEKQPENKQKLKKIDQREAAESPLEKLKRLENAKPVEIGDSGPDPGELTSTLPVYDLPSKREKTKLKEYKTEEKDVSPRVTMKKEQEKTEWEKLMPKREQTPEKTPLIILGKGDKSGRFFHFTFTFVTY